MSINHEEIGYEALYDGMSRDTNPYTGKAGDEWDEGWHAAHVEKTVWDAHMAELIRLYGQKRASRANLGWGTDEGSIATKVYGDPADPDGNPCMVLVTTYDPETGEIVSHDEREY